MKRWRMRLHVVGVMVADYEKPFEPILRVEAETAKEACARLQSALQRLVDAEPPVDADEVLGP